MKIIPTGVAEVGDGMGENSSHRGFFLEAITLHLSSWTRGIQCELIAFCDDEVQKTLPKQQQSQLFHSLRKRIIIVSEF